ncbi:MAG: hypothetical protein J0H34_06495 [Rhizobiales bacterium]|nr:hypothetical protein [Hyphomicrobiales bacterium]
MSKYEPLNVFLRSQTRDQVPMTFAEIERVLDDKLPPSKANRAWWSNNPNNNVMTREWLNAGYETESVDIAGEKLVFRRMRQAKPGGNGGSGGDAPSSPRPRHPGFGFMKGLVVFEAGFDPTKPFDDEPWDRGYLGQDGKK